MMRIRLCVAIAAFALLVAGPARAAVTWVADVVPYSLTGAELFRLSKQLPPELRHSFDSIRGRVFGSEDAFRSAVSAAIPSDADRTAWVDRLEEAARRPGVSYGIETRADGVTTLILSGTDHALDANAFTSSSWLAHLPPPDPVSDVTASFADGCLDVAEAGRALLSLCNGEIGTESRAVYLKTDVEEVLGLGQQFDNPGDTSVNRLGTRRIGFNQMSAFNNGANGNTLFPIAYFERQDRPFALFLDNRYPQEWDFTAAPFRISVKGGDLRLHLITADSLAELRHKYMVMSGTPPVPPKSAFGLWISEYGYDNWAELDSKVDSLDANGFPLSGVVMDLQWFGGIAGPSGSHMGSLTWDRGPFPDPERKIADFADRGIAMMLIEESYIDKSLPEFTELAGRGFLAHDVKGNVLMTSPTPQWWGHGGMIDWANPEAGAFWHDYRRQKLIDMGITAHWTDLGEPEMFNPANLYGSGLTEPMVHNSYNLLWLKSIADGYRRDAPDKRPFMMSRSGGSGMQALGAAMWSGDIGGDFYSLASQMPQQTHMMWSGMDYYGSDIGGFHRGALRHYDGAPNRDAAMNALYTQWFAYSSLFEVPVRSHTENLCNCKETAPDRIGDLKSNLAAIRLRQRLLPYYYSQAFRAWRSGEPVFPSLEYWYPDDPLARKVGATKMIGRDLVGAGVARYGETEAPIYLPTGSWYDVRDGAVTRSSGEFKSVPLYRDGLFALPLFARDGALIPTTEDETPTLTVYGLGDGQGDWFDDDGKTMAYQKGDYQQIAMVKTGQNIVLSRVRGTALTPQKLVWVLPSDVAVGRLLVDGVETPYESANGILTLPLPAFDKGLTISLEVGVPGT